MQKFLGLSMLGLLIALSSGGFARAQEEADDEAVFAVDGPTAAAAVDNDNDNDTSTPAGTRALGAVRGAQRADSLGGSFVIQRMSVTLNGRKVLFWGARITSLDKKSPLKTLGVRAGDVITRLDGIRLENGMHKNRDGEWVSPELDRHFGDTEVRYIISGTNRVRIGEVTLDDPGSGSGGVVEP